MTVISDAVKSTGRQITVRITSNNRITNTRLKQIGDPYEITKTFAANDKKRYMMEVLKSEVKNELKNFVKQSSSLMHAELEFDV